MVDTLKTCGIGGCSFVMQFMAMVPEIVKVAVGIATVAYLIVKIKKEMGW
tara:strand:- start:1099 stop:1248 length:150 start_codon:yes stop_codon:yes gene_type:complete